MAAAREALTCVRGWRQGAAVVLLPSLFAGDWIWQPVSDELIANGFTVLQLTEPFARLETRPPAMATLRKIVIDALNEHGIERAVLCGASLGGMLAIDIAVHCPEMTESLVISGCPGLGAMADLGVRTASQLPEAESIALIAAQVFHDPSRIAHSVLRKSYEVIADRPCVTNMARWLVAARHYDLFDAMPRVECPVRLIWGDNDRIAPVDEWRPHLDRFRNAALHVIPACGHSPMIEKPREFYALLT